jgi:RNA polymerase sigma factor (sigma-70 family)
MQNRHCEQESAGGTLKREVDTLIATHHDFGCHLVQDRESEKLMQDNKKGEVTALLVRWSNKDPKALNDLFPLIVNELNELAGRLLKTKPKGYICDPRELVNELYLRLVDKTSIAFPVRGFFFHVAGQAMRDILVDNLRKKYALKRSGPIPKVAIDELAGYREVAADESDDRQGIPLPNDLRKLPREMSIDFLHLLDLMERLKKMDEVQYDIVSDRVFAGLTVKEIAEYMDIPEGRVKREYKLAKAWLSREAVKSSGDQYDAGRVSKR